MKENKTLEELYKESPRHEFGDISLFIENRGGKLQGKFVFHHIDADDGIVEKSLLDNGLPACFGRPPNIVDSDVNSEQVWNEHYRTLGDIIPTIEKEIEDFGHMMENLGDKLVQCARCPVFERCYRIAELNLQRRNVGEKIDGRWQR